MAVTMRFNGREVYDELLKLDKEPKPDGVFQFCGTFYQKNFKIFPYLEFPDQYETSIPLMEFDADVAIYESMRNCRPGYKTNTLFNLFFEKIIDPGNIKHTCVKYHYDNCNECFAMYCTVSCESHEIEKSCDCLTFF